MTRVAHFGLGVMGLPMATTLHQSGVDVVATDLNPAAIAAFVELGGSGVAFDEFDVAGVNVVLTMLPEAKHVHSVYESVLARVVPGTVFIDCSTIDVAETRELARQVERHGCSMIDAPVSGGSEGAAAGTLSFMVGGEPESIQKVQPLLDIMGQRTTMFGPTGMGQSAKACHNMIVGITGLAVFEGFALAEALGLDAHDFHALCSNAAAACWTLDNRCPVPGVVDHAPSSNGYQPGFAARLMAKDLALAQQASASAGIDTPFGREAANRFANFVAEGNGDSDYSALFQTLRAGSSL